MDKRIESVMENLRKNRMVAEYVETGADALEWVKAHIPAGASIGMGGSVSVKETGILDYLKNGDFRFFDSHKPDLTPEKKAEEMKAAAFADYYFCSSNAITEDGSLYNVDGNCNRISAIAHGPKRVIMVVGVNKIVPGIADAVKRVKTVAAPLNTKRLGCATYCREAGHCVKVDGAPSEGCQSPERICCNYLISGYQRIPDRIAVLLVGESLGF